MRRKETYTTPEASRGANFVTVTNVFIVVGSMVEEWGFVG
jgi:hypothetical protein